MENIKADAFREYMNDHFPAERTIEVGGIQVTVKTRLSVDSMIDFVNFVVNNCFQGDECLPQLKDFLIRIEIIRMYTNIELPNNIQDQYEFVYGSDLIGQLVDEVINRNEFNNILQAIDFKIAQIEDVAYQEYKAKIEEIYSSINAITEQISQIYDEMSPEDLTDIIKVMAGMSDGSVSDEEIARAMMNYKAQIQEKEDDK